MRYALMIEAQQGLSYEDQLALARRAEAAGFEAFFRSDHFASFPGAADRPTTDAWSVLAGLARETERIGLGTLVSPVTFRHPGTFAKQVITVDQMSGGRIELGVGAGWNADDHLPLGLAFPPIAERAELLEDQLALLHGLWTEPDGWSYEGAQVRVQDARFRPRAVPVEGRPQGPDGTARPRIIMGGGGSPRSMRMAARWADEFNVTGAGPDDLAIKLGAVVAACRAAGRDPATMTRSAMVPVLVGETAADVEARQEELFEELGLDDGRAAWFQQRRYRWILGTPDEARAMVARIAAAGVERIFLQDFIPRDLGHIDLLGRELVAAG
jgi:alkanesulfonate monooxygenase SsuD/methylene tetrahydromethanopterin reductase-like flavin-dependent oxidoreductase (luciferase family)